jgi:hypothetical protein
MKNFAINFISIFSTKMTANRRVVMVILSALVLSGCTGLVLGTGAALLGSQMITFGEKRTSFYDFGKGEITLFQIGCNFKGTWKNNSDKEQRNVRVDLQALDKDGNTLGVSKLNFYATSPDGTSDSKGHGVWTITGSAMDNQCRRIAAVFAEAYLYK